MTLFDRPGFPGRSSWDYTALQIRAFSKGKCAKYANQSMPLENTATQNLTGKLGDTFLIFWYSSQLRGFSYRVGGSVK